MSDRAAALAKALTTNDLYVELKAALDSEIAAYKAAFAGPLTLASAWTLTMMSISDFVKIAKDAPQISESDRRTAIMQVAGDFYDAVLKDIRIPGVPNFIATNFLDPALRSLWLQLIDGTITGIEGLVTRIQNPPAPVTPDVPSANY